MTQRRRPSSTSATRLPSSSPAIDLVQGADGVWHPARDARPVTQAAVAGRGSTSLVTPATATVRGGADGTKCILCKRPVRTKRVLAHVGPFVTSIPVCRKCGELGLHLFDLLRR
jgi:hypothetical protein